MSNKTVVKSKKYFTHQEVEEYTKRVLTSAEKTMCEQKDLIIGLKKELDALTQKYKESEEKISQLQRAVLESNRSSKQSKKDGDVLTKLMIEKVQQYGLKWKNYFEELFNEVGELKGNASIELFVNDTNDLVEELVEAGNIRLKADDKIIPTRAEMVLSEKILNEKGLNNEDEELISLSKNNEEKYKKVIERLKKQMIFASELSEQSEDGFNIQEALNPTDDLKDIIKDLSNK